jgi:F-type H+-transporting ATPase subunit delta
MRNLQAMAAEKSEFQPFLESPLHSRIEKQNVISKLFANFHASSKGLFTLMTSKNREALLPLVAQEFMAIYGTENGITEAEVSSAVELEEKELDAIRAFIKQKTGARTVNIHTGVDASLIGGLRIMFDGKLYDSSISSQINTLKKELKIA